MNNQKIDSYITDLFPESGWKVFKDVIPLRVLSKIKEYLIGRQQRLQGRLDSYNENLGLPKMPYLEAQSYFSGVIKGDIGVDLTHYLRGEYELETRLSKTLMKVFETDSFVKTMNDFLKCECFYIHYPPMVRYIPPGASKSGVPLHQDSSYNSHITDFMTVWIPFTKITDTCGGVICYEKSQYEVFQHDLSADVWEYEIEDSFEKFNQRHIVVEPGDLLLFPQYLLHKSAGNTSNDVRFSMDLRLFVDPEGSKKSYYDSVEKNVVRKGL